MEVTFENLGTVNKNAVILGDLELIFSYKTPVAFRLGWGPYVVRQNDWSTTTGKLLNEYEPDKKARVTGEEFVKQLEAILSKIQMTDGVTQ